MYRSRVSYETKLERGEGGGEQRNKKKAENREIETKGREGEREREREEGEWEKGQQREEEERVRRWVETWWTERTTECEHPPARRGISSWLSHAFLANWHLHHPPPESRSNRIKILARSHLERSTRRKNTWFFFPRPFLKSDRRPAPSMNFVASIWLTSTCSIWTNKDVQWCSYKFPLYVMRYLFFRNITFNSKNTANPSHMQLSRRRNKFST